ncbi:hypothetical protein AVKW3434_13990 [Acidovorax sp. SUPP3434]|uniref:hypothetical protein n=1 Tax=Acidovorax sp. SUPP3434 TaxID=2920880 RepID=UPI0023DE4B76|nr:hypothetical protein [Acidovorax sp. SUPP3434]GKT00509.1 hypothetical protein AVKW3434_13990 [Acidovorax sp. SUPP3434]
MAVFVRDRICHPLKFLTCGDHPGKTLAQSLEIDDAYLGEVCFVALALAVSKRLTRFVYPGEFRDGCLQWREQRWKPAISGRTQFLQPVQQIAQYMGRVQHYRQRVSQ